MIAHLRGLVMHRSSIFAALCAVLLTCGGAVAGVAEERVLWQHPFDAQLWSSPVHDDGRLYFGGDDGVMYAFDLEAREVAWSFKTTGRIRSTPDITNGVVTFAGDDGKLYALGQTNGDSLWAFDLGGGLTARRLPALDAPYSYDYMSSSPVHADGVIYVGSVNGQLFAIDHETGEERWRFATTEMVRATPMVEGGKVYFGGWDGFVYALDANTGAEIWRFDTGGSVQGALAIGSGKVIVGSRSARILALDAGSGEEAWVHVHQDGSWVESSPVIEGDVIYVGSSDALAAMAIDLSTGEEIWRYKTDGWSWCTPTLSGGTLYIGAMAAHPYYFEGVELKAGFHAVEQKTGEAKWRVDTAPIKGFITGGVFARPVVIDGVVYVCGLDGTLTALKK